MQKTDRNAHAMNRQGGTLGLLSLALACWAGTAPAQESAETLTSPGSQSPAGLAATPGASALLSSNWNVGFTLGAGFGPEIMGSRSEHHLAAGILHVGKLLNSEKPGLRNLELGGELWAGGQYHPEAAYVTGLTPVLRYHFRRDSRWRPFLDAGLGFVLTDIGLPDLSTTYQFSPQAGAGFHWELREHLAFTLQARYIHMSNAGFEMPNFGVNTFLFSGGLTRFF